ncbi:hypothetical protein SLS59_001983 [Nothophoma quercina]|uniref:Uncharacterized protein n=1 Tax=Nothophoma quercina TaxID=749835 RepID=A0ABR3RWK3_9PLEO
MDVKSKFKIKTCSIAALVVGVVDDMPEEVQHDIKLINVKKRSYEIFKSLFRVPSSETPEYLWALKWDDFKRAMVSVGFSAEKLHGSAWQFALINAKLSLQRGIQFHKTRLQKEIRFAEVQGFGRRLQQAHAWDGNMFRLA